jgi:hypothetical protein
LFYLLCFFFYKIRTGGWNRFCGSGGELQLALMGGGRERGRRMHMVQTMYTHVCKCKNDTVETVPGMVGEGIKENDGGVNSSMIYLIHCKCISVPTPSTRILKKERKTF